MGCTGTVRYLYRSPQRRWFRAFVRPTEASKLVSRKHTKARPHPLCGAARASLDPLREVSRVTLSGAGQDSARTARVEGMGGEEGGGGRGRARPAPRGPPAKDAGGIRSRFRQGSGELREGPAAPLATGTACSVAHGLNSASPHFLRRGNPSRSVASGEEGAWGRDGGRGGSPPRRPPPPSSPPRRAASRLGPPWKRGIV